MSKCIRDFGIRVFEDTIYAVADNDEIELPIKIDSKIEGVEIEKFILALRDMANEELKKDDLHLTSQDKIEEYDEAEINETGIVDQYIAEMTGGKK